MDLLPYGSCQLSGTREKAQGVTVLDRNLHNLILYPPSNIKLWTPPTAIENASF